MQNIVINARQAMGGAGVVRVSAGAEAVDEAGTLPLAPGSYVHVSIADTGPGIPEDAMGRVFDPFFTTKERGTGLGLPIAHQLVKGHGGEIRIEDGTPSGASFVVTLPVERSSS